MPLAILIKPRAQRELERVAIWWADNRPAAPGAVRKDTEAALALLAQEPGLGAKVETPRKEVVRRLYLPRLRYFIYYRVHNHTLEVIAFWHESRGHRPSL